MYAAADLRKLPKGQMKYHIDSLWNLLYTIYTVSCSICTTMQQTVQETMKEIVKMIQSTE